MKKKRKKEKRKGDEIKIVSIHDSCQTPSTKLAAIPIPKARHGKLKKSPQSSP